MKRKTEDTMTQTQLAVARWIRHNAEPVYWKHCLAPGARASLRTLKAMERKGFLSHWVPVSGIVAGGDSHYCLSADGRAYLKMIEKEAPGFGAN